MCCGIAADLAEGTCHARVGGVVGENGVDIVGGGVCGGLISADIFRLVTKIDTVACRGEDTKDEAVDTFGPVVGNEEMG